MSSNFLRSLAITSMLAGGFVVNDVVNEPTVAHASTNTKVMLDGHAYSKQVAETLKYINAERKAMGLKELKIDAKLSKSAELHAKYLFENVRTSEHNQTPDKTGFTGVNHVDRAKAAGYIMYEGVESVTYGLGLTPYKVVKLTLEGVYHRPAIISPKWDTVGIGIYGFGHVMVLDNQSKTQIKEEDKTLNAYPYPGQTNAPTTFDIKEKPDPLAKYGVETSGYIISALPSKTVKSSDSVKIILKDSENNVISLLNKDSIADMTSAKGLYYVIPKDPLENGETYHATIIYTGNDGNSYSESWSFKTEKSDSDELTPYSSYEKRFSDFDENAWWVDDMVWAIERDLINGYSNVWNPKTKKYETQLQPYTQLTEAHFLNIFFRYAEKEALANIKKSSDWYHSGVYQIAQDKQMPVLANKTSVHSKKLADEGIRRGKLAQLMASYYYGKTISENEAIQFFIDNKITTAESIAAYNPDQILTRSQISAFIQRYDSFVSK